MATVCGSKDLPINDKASWDGTTAKSQMLERAGGKGNFSASKYAQGFVIRDGDANLLGSYKLPFAEVIDGKLTATWGGVRYAMGAVMGARTPMTLSDADRKKAYNFLKAYYKKFDKPVPDFKQALKFYGVLFGERENINLPWKEETQEESNE